MNSFQGREVIQISWEKNGHILANENTAIILAFETFIRFTCTYIFLNRKKSGAKSSSLNSICKDFQCTQKSLLFCLQILFDLWWIITVRPVVILFEFRAIESRKE